MITDFIHNITQSTDIPLLTAFVLGLLTALNPCQLAISVSALAYEYKKGNKLFEGLLYALGRTITYTVLGWIIMCLIGGGRNIEGFQTLLSKGEILLPYILIIIGAFMLYRTFIHHHHDGESCHNSGQIIKRNGPLGSLMLGITLAFAFCPESAVFYFGLMIPLAMTSSVSIFIPLTFGLAAAIPVICIAWIMNKAIYKAEKISHNFETFQKILNAVTGLLFIAMAVVLMVN